MIGSGVTAMLTGRMRFAGGTGLQVIDVSNPDSLTLVGSYDTAGEVIRVFAEGILAYDADNASLMILGAPACDVDMDHRLSHCPLSLETYPNPCYGSTNICWSLALAADVRIDIHDLAGRRVVDVCHGWMSPGDYQIVWDASNIPSGIYFCRIAAAGSVLTRSIMVLG